ncbi:MAG: histidine kinase [Gemmatimonadota bacterium]
MEQMELPHPAAGAGLPDRPSLRLRGRRTLSRGLARRFIQVPLFYKIVIANALIVVVAFFAGIRLTPRLGVDWAPISRIGMAAVLAVLILLLSVALNAFLVNLALSPLRGLEETARRVERGELDARVILSPLADRELARLTEIFNRMVASIEALQQRHRALTVRAIDAEERERKRIAGELLDNTAQALAAILLQIRIARTAASEEETAHLHELRREVFDTLDAVRKLARELRPPEIDELGVSAALESYARARAEATGRAIQVRSSVGGAVLPSSLTLALYRIVQTTVEDAIQHEDATRIDVNVALEGSGVVATVTYEAASRPGDADTQRTRALDLFELQERAVHLGGSAAIENCADGRKRVRIEFPVRPALGTDSQPPGRHGDHP